ncbi:MAG: DUF1858 domain-containing protein [Clostridia bacterium]|nr:DUF1858 domain-containing protein [Clostridia bacterium]
MEITKDMLIADLLRAKPEAADVLMASGMHCLGCAMAHGESIEGACMVHGIDVEELLARINAL